MAGTMSSVAATGQLQSSDASASARPVAGLAAGIWKHLPPGALHGAGRRASVAVTKVIKLDTDAFLRNGASRAYIAMLRTTLQISISVTALAFNLG